MTKVIIVTQNFCPVNSTVHSGNLHLWKKPVIRNAWNRKALISNPYELRICDTEKLPSFRINKQNHCNCGDD